MTAPLISIRLSLIAPLTNGAGPFSAPCEAPPRSEEHTSELQSQSNLVCRLLLEKKKNTSPHRRLLRPMVMQYQSPRAMCLSASALLICMPTRCETMRLDVPALIITFHHS